MSWIEVQAGVGRTDRVRVTANKRVYIAKALATAIGSPERVDVFVDPDRRLVKVAANPYGSLRLTHESTGARSFSARNLCRLLGVVTENSEHWSVVQRDSESFVVEAN